MPLLRGPHIGTTTTPSDLFVDGADNAELLDLNENYVLPDPDGAFDDVVDLANYGALAFTDSAAYDDGTHPSPIGRGLMRDAIAPVAAGLVAAL